MVYRRLFVKTEDAPASTAGPFYVTQPASVAVHSCKRKVKPDEYHPTKISDVDATTKPEIARLSECRSQGIVMLSLEILLRSATVFMDLSLPTCDNS